MGARVHFVHAVFFWQDILVLLDWQTHGKACAFTLMPKVVVVPHVSALASETSPEAVSVTPEGRVIPSVRSNLIGRLLHYAHTLYLQLPHLLQHHTTSVHSNITEGAATVTDVLRGMANSSKMQQQGASLRSEKTVHKSRGQAGTSEDGTSVPKMFTQRLVADQHEITSGASALFGPAIMFMRGFVRDASRAPLPKAAIIAIAVVAMALCWCCGAIASLLTVARTYPAEARHHGGRCVRSVTDVGCAVVSTTSNSAHSCYRTVTAVPVVAAEMIGGHTTSGTRRWVQI